MEGNAHFNAQLQKRPWSIRPVYWSLVGTHFALWFHFAKRCLMLEFRW